MLIFPTTVDTNTTYEHQNRDIHSLKQDLGDEQAIAVTKFVLALHVIKVRI